MLEESKLKSSERNLMEKLGEDDRERFLEMTGEEKRTVLTENIINHQENRMMERDETMNQLVDRLATKSFQ